MSDRSIGIAGRAQAAPGAAPLASPAWHRAKRRRAVGVLFLVAVFADPGLQATAAAKVCREDTGARPRFVTVAEDVICPEPRGRLSVLAASSSPGSSVSGSAPASRGEPARVTEVIDGDTLEVEVGGRRERVRLIGVDTPEVHDSEKLDRDAARSGLDRQVIQALGRQDSEAVKRWVEPGDEVELELKADELRDSYGRLLAFVWLPDGGMLNERIVCEGYGNAYTSYPFRSDYMDRFRECAREARDNGLGLWGESAGGPSLRARRGQE